MIGVLGGMGTQAGLDFCNKLTKFYRGKLDSSYPMFVLYNKSNVPDRIKNINKYQKVFKSLLNGCSFLKKNKCKFIVIPCNTAHYWYEDLCKRISTPILSMPKEVFLQAKKECKSGSKIGLLATEGTINTGVYDKYFQKKFIIVNPKKMIQKKNVNKSIKLVKMGKIKEAGHAIKPAINYLMKSKCKKIILGCTELPIAIFAYKPFKNIKISKIFLDPNLILAKAAVAKYKL